MGYETKYQLTISGPAQDTSLLEAYLEAVVIASEESGNDEDPELVIAKVFFNEADKMKWYEYEEHMKEISSSFPTVLFQITGYGEQPRDIWTAYFKGGKFQRSQARIEFEPFDESKMI